MNARHMCACAIHGSRKCWAIHGLSAQSKDPYFEQRNPWIVPIHGLRITYLVFYNEATLISMTDTAHTMLACSRDKHHHYYYKPAHYGSQCDVMASTILRQYNTDIE